MTSPKGRVGLLGGAFNPPHLGHLRLAALALEHLALGALRFVPTAHSPRKPAQGEDGATRLRLLQAAVEGLGGPVSVESLELDRGGISYTVDTLEALTAREPENAWIWLLGSDQLVQFDQWKNGARILELASLAVALRPGCPKGVPETLAGRLRESWSGGPGELVWLPSTELELSSSQLRQGISQGWVPDGIPIQVQAAIERENLYR